MPEDIKKETIDNETAENKAEEIEIEGADEESTQAAEEAKDTDMNETESDDDASADADAKADEKSDEKKGLFKKKKKHPVITVNFKEYIADNINKSFLFETLKLDEKDYFRFLEFCEADTNASMLVQEANEFKIVNFLFEKKEAFDRL